MSQYYPQQVPPQFNPYHQQMHPQMNQPPIPPWMTERIEGMNQRLAQNQQYQQYGQQLGQPTQTQQPQNLYNAMPFTTMEDIKAFPVSFDERQYIFVDKEAGKIHVKKWDKATGGLSYSTFVPEQSTSPQEDLTEDSKGNNTPAWEEEINRLDDEIKRLEGLLNDATDSSNSGGKKSASKPTNTKSTVKSKSDGGTGADGGE